MARATHTSSEPYGAPEWLASLTSLTAAVGSPTFEDAVLQTVRSVVHVDTCAVFTFRERSGPGHVFTTGRIDAAVGQGLADDYVGRYYALDPNFARLARPGENGHELLRFDPDALSTPYLRRFFVESDLVDKVSWIVRSDDRAVYCNFYRRGGSGRYDRRDHARLNAVVPLVANVIALHSLLRPAFTPRDPADELRRLSELATSPLDDLTPREREVCLRILLGYTSEAIALGLGIAPSSVITYRKRAYEKLGICSQAELFTLYLRSLRVFAT